MRNKIRPHLKRNGFETDRMAGMRTLTDHIVDGDAANHQITIEVEDEPGAGGANHEYALRWTEKSDLPAIGNIAHIWFQNGPIKEKGVNGVTHEALLAIIIDRLRSFQAGPFSCEENRVALNFLTEALWFLQKRTRERIKRGVEGTMQK